MKYFSMFSGIGGFELGIYKGYHSLLGKRYKEGLESIRRNGYSSVFTSKDRHPQAVGFSEIDKYAIQIYEKHFKGHKAYGNAKDIIPERIQDFDLLVGGFPCQSFSVAGKRKGFDDTRGTLFFEIARILKYKRPRYILLENVKGLLSHDSGKTFQTILKVLSDIGYRVEWQVLNSKNFGVPQNRERVFIIGHLRGTSRPKVFPIKESCGTNDKTIAHTINSSDWRGGNRNQKQTTIAVLTPDRAEKRQNGRRFKENGEPSFTLTERDIHGIYDGCNIRRLTPTECERLQGFPDGWTEGISDTQRYKCLGNAVTVNVIEYIITKLIEGGETD